VEASLHIGGMKGKVNVWASKKMHLFNLFIYSSFLVRVAVCCIFCPQLFPTRRPDLTGGKLPAQPGGFAQTVVLHEQVGVAAPN